MSEQAEAVPRPRAITAAAQKLTQTKIDKFAKSAQANKGWQNDAWLAFDQVGEHRFLTMTLAQRAGQAGFYVGLRGDDPDQPPEPLHEDDDKLSEAARLAMEAWEEWGDTEAHRQQMVTRMVANLFVAGEGWFAGIPTYLVEEVDEAGDQPVVDSDSEVQEIPATGKAPKATGTGPDGQEVFDLEMLTWRMLSNDEVKPTRDGEVVLYLADSTSSRGSLTVDPDDVFLVRVWRPHPRMWWDADSPTRSSLPVLRELIGLTMHVSAQIDSRLAGAGLLLIPDPVKAAMLRQLGADPGDEDDPFVDDLIKAMTTPITDRASAAAYVPYLVTGPGEELDKIRHLNFSQPLDQEARQLREEAIRRLALSLDAPPELLLGVANMNHWGAWLVREDVITTHVEPPLQLVCDALTSAYLHPALIASGVPEEEAEQYVIWYTVQHLIGRPNRTADAQALYSAGVLSPDALRSAAQFDDDDAPPQPTVAETVLNLLQAQPSLYTDVGVQAMIQDVTALRELQASEMEERDAQEQAERTAELNEEITEPEQQFYLPDTMDADEGTTSEVGGAAPAEAAS